MDVEYVDVAKLKDTFGMGRTFAYERLNAQDFRARKVGRKTLIEVQSVREYLARQPLYRVAA